MIDAESAVASAQGTVEKCSRGPGIPISAAAGRLRAVTAGSGYTGNYPGPLMTPVFMKGKLAPMENLSQKLLPYLMQIQEGMKALSPP